MTSTNFRPRWWQVYLSFPLLIALFVVDNRLKLSTRGHQAVQIMILLLVYGIIHLWLKANARALSRMDQQSYAGTVRVIRIPIAYDSEGDYENRSTLQISESEIKGLLTDSANLNYVDADSSSLHDIHQQ